MKRKTHKKRIVPALLISLTISATICCVCGAELSGFRSSAMVSYDSLFTGGNVKISYANAPVGVEDYDPREGLRLTTEKEGASFRFVETASGVFEMEYRVFSEVRNEYDLESLRIEFTDANTADSFAVEIGLRQDGLNGYYTASTTAVRAVVDAGYGKGYAIDERTGTFTTYGKTLLSSYCNAETDSVIVGFDPSTMQIYAYEKTSEAKYLLADLDNTEHLQAMGREIPLSDFSKYYVDIEFDRFAENAKSAGVMIYSILGNDIEERYLRETQGPSVYVNTQRKAKLNEAYDLLKTVEVYDLLEGNIAFDGEINVYSPYGEALIVENASFTPTQTGIYTVEYVAKNGEGVYGKKQTTVLEVVDHDENISVSSSRYFENDLTLGVGASVVLPSVIVQSNYLDKKDIPCDVRVVDAESTLFSSKRAWEENGFTFTKSGEYQIVYTADLGGAVPFTQTYDVTVSAETPVFTGESVNEIYAYGEILTIPEKTVELNGNEYLSTSKVFLSDGRTNGSSSVLLDVEGLCSVEYSVEIEEVVYTYVERFEVCKTSAQLWENQGGMTFVENVDLPTYADQYGNGVLLQAARTGATARYKSVLDLSNGNLQAPVLSAMFTPDTSGKKDIESLEIRLTDANDPENYVIVKIEEVKWGYGMRSSFTCKANNFDYDFFGVDQNGKMNYTQIYSPMSGKYDGANGIAPAWKFDLYFDAATRSIYAGPSGLNDQTLALVADLDDPDQVGEGNEWQGFSTGEVVLELRFNGLQASSSKLTVLSVFGQSMGGETLKDDQAPFLTLENYDEGSVPKAVVGKAYRIFKGKLFDSVDGDLGEVKNYGVYCLNNGNKSYLPIENGTFIPTEATKYYVEYFGVDRSNNVTMRTIEIQAVSETSEMTYELNGDFAAEIPVGTTLRIPEGEASGGAGYLAVQTRLKSGDTVYNELDDEFQFLVGGAYVYEVVVTDYIGQTKKFEYPFTVVYSEAPIVDELKLPKAILLGKPYVFPAFEIKKYGVGTVTELPLTITVNGTTLGQDLTYTPTDTQTLEVVYSTEGWNKTFTVQVVDPSLNESYLNGFFLFDEDVLSINATEEYLAFETDETKARSGKAEFSFINPLGLTNARVEFGVLKGNFERINVYFTDKYDASVALKFTISKNPTVGETSYFALNDGKNRPINGSFYEGQTRTPLAIVFKNNKIYDYAGNLLSSIDKTASGDTFVGFPSGEVYVDFEIEGIFGEASVALYQLWNQLCTMTYGDYLSPVISVGEFADEVKVGDIVTVPKAVAFDVLDPLVTMTLTVRCGTQTLNDVESGKALSNVLMGSDDDYSFKVEEFGQYKISIFVTDSEGNAYEYQKSLFVDGSIKPTITLKGEFKDSYKVGETLRSPEATATDYNGDDLRVYVYFVDTSSRYHDLTSGYELTETGRFTVLYYCYDEFGNYVIESYSVIVE